MAHSDPSLPGEGKVFESRIARVLLGPEQRIGNVIVEREGGGIRRNRGETGTHATLVVAHRRDAVGRQRGRQFFVCIGVDVGLRVISVVIGWSRSGIDQHQRIGLTTVRCIELAIQNARRRHDLHRHLGSIAAIATVRSAIEHRGRTTFAAAAKN